MHVVPRLRERRQPVRRAYHDQNEGDTEEAWVPPDYLAERRRLEGF